MDKENDLLFMAWRQIEKDCEENGTIPMMYSRDNSGCEKYGGNEYVVFRNTSEILSVFLVDNGKLTGVEMDDFPEELLEEVSA